MPDQPRREPGHAWFAGVELEGVTDVIDVRDQPERLREPGWWVVVGEFDGRVRAWRFAERTDPVDAGVHEPVEAEWRSSLSHADYVAAVDEIRARILEGD